jgi:beta-lactamase regulating signal transducer with metallopeptidase domain
MWPFELLHDPAWQPLTCTLLHFLWQGTVVAAAWTVLFRLSRARTMQFRYALGLAGMLAMATCPVATFALLQSRAGADKIAPSGLRSAADGRLGRGVVDRHSDAASLAFAEGGVNRANDAGERRAGGGDGSREASLWKCDPGLWIGRAQPYLLGGWMLGLVVLSGRLMFGVFAAHRLGRGRLAIAGEIGERVKALAVRLGFRAVPRVFSTKAAREAVVTGLLRPMVLLPAVWLAGMPRDVLEAVIAHELAHIRRYDVWFNLFQRFVEALLFYHPVVWWLSRRVRLAREMCCDEMAARATGERVVYATALELAARKRLEPVGRLLQEVALGITRMSLLDRVRNVLGLAARHEQGRWWPAAVMTLLVLPAVWFASMAATSADEKPIAVQPAKKESRTQQLVLKVDAKGNVAAAKPIRDIDEFLSAKAREILSTNHMTAADPEAGKDLPTTVVIRIARDAPFAKIEVLIKACHEHGFQRMSFALDKEAASPAGTPKAAEAAGTKHSATAIFRIAMEEKPVFGASYAPMNRETFEIYKNTQAELLKSRLVLTAALHNPKIVGLQWLERHEAPSNSVKWLADRLEVSFPANSELMKVSLHTSGPVDAVALLTAVADAYLREVVSAEEQQKGRRFDELDRSCSEQGQRLRNKREELKGLAGTAGRIDPGIRAARAKIVLEELALYRNRLAAAGFEISRYKVDLAVQKAYLEDAKGDARAPILKEIKRLEVSIRMTNEQQAELRKTIGKLEETATELSNTESVDMEMLRTEIASIEASLSKCLAEKERLGVELRAPPRIALVEPAQ